MAEEKTTTDSGSGLKKVKKPVSLKGQDVPIPHDMATGLPDDMAIIARLIDANCRAYSELYGYHLDSRCLSHYNEGIVRLTQAGVMSLVPVLEADGTPKVKKTKKRDEKTGEEYEEEEIVVFEDVTDAPAQAVRVRAEYVPYDKMVSRPTSDPIWKLQAEELNRLRMELKRAREGKGAGEAGMTAPPEVATAPTGPVPTSRRAALPPELASGSPQFMGPGPFTFDPTDPDVPAWMRDAPITPMPDPASMPRNAPFSTLERHTDPPTAE